MQIAMALGHSFGRVRPREVGIASTCLLGLREGLSVILMWAVANQSLASAATK